MADHISLELGAAPWLPAPDTARLAEYQYYDFPTCGVLGQGGRDYIFMCVGGQDSEVQYWAYFPLPAADREYLESADGWKDFNERLHHLELRPVGVLALATDAYGILTWQTFDPNSPISLRTAAIELSTRMGRVAEGARDEASRLDFSNSA